uniref:Uncharacterized protein n=1 Tax=Corvus moneduloides TaxID=1196302 RepID=A0A8U7N1B0_CORMO
MAAAALCWALRAARQVLPSPCPKQVRSYYVDWRMLRDVKRRKMAYEHADERLRINAIRKNSILPRELQVPAAAPRLRPAGARAHTWLLLLWRAQGHGRHFIDPDGCPRAQVLCFPSSQAQNHGIFVVTSAVWGCLQQHSELTGGCAHWGVGFFETSASCNNKYSEVTLPTSPPPPLPLTYIHKPIFFTSSNTE